MKVALRACNLQNPRASRSEPMRADANRPQVLGSWAPSLAVFCVCALSPLAPRPPPPNRGAYSLHVRPPRR